MKRTRTTMAVVAMTAGVVSAMNLPALAGPAPLTGPSSSIAPEVYGAVQRDLGISPDQVAARFRLEEQASRIEPVLRRQLGPDFGGGFLTPDGTAYHVGVLDDAGAAKARALGARPVTVTRTEQQLDAIRDRLGTLLHDTDVPYWYTDVTTNTVVVKAHPAAVARTRALITTAGVEALAVRVVETTEAPRPLIDVVGGNAYYIGSGTRCSVGFSVTTGFVTAGHCGRPGSTTSQPSGTFQGSSFPGNDYAWVRVAAGNTPRGLVNNYNGGAVSVAGSAEAPVGSSICRSGSTTGWHCGTIQARNASVTYPEGTIYGLIQTNVCAEPGDSGGSAITGSQAQGVTSGGSGNCRSGGTTFFQPVNEILQTYGLTLLTSGPQPTPTSGPGGCTGYSGTVPAGGSVVEPNDSYYQSTEAGTHSSCLRGPAGTDFDLALQKWTGNAWSQVAISDSPSNAEQITYRGTAGYYRYVVTAYAGSGSYTMSITRPA
ncbi:serine protease [Longispora fulva]|uniref:Streptogrisin C n=1 Tax=Longispora fulva TaxID=619741 RepID=A0A8J7KEW3_9ACTN|nr:S1 family peptidase [Longispora fulva]MBG6135450.1 streptogrisin C [Longispora fulva]GIG56307.1 serine protease [Longispora fulva]